MRTGFLRFLVTIGLASTAGACADDERREDDALGGFVSANPDATEDLDEEDAGDFGDGGGSGGFGPTGGAVMSASGAGPGPGPGPGPSTGTGAAAPPTDESIDPERLIGEADIVHRAGDRLFVLSDQFGLAVVDTAGGALRLLGVATIEADPFEMYVDGDAVHVLIDVVDEWSGVAPSSLVRTYDVADPAAIVVRRQHELAGGFADSRIVGGVLYAVTFDFPSWGAGNVYVSSMTIGPSGPRPVDRAVITRDWGAPMPSVVATEDRLYVTARNTTTSASGDMIEVFDISSPNGTLARGASVPVSGPIDARWQMDEIDGVLRVITQLDIDHAPAIETFDVSSLETATPIGAASVELPRPEVITSARFDGERGYLITAVPLPPEEPQPPDVPPGFADDPLYVIDLSNPATPTVSPGLELPGWIIHIEPRGDRLVTLGMDRESSAGSLHVSLYDVSTMGMPQEIRRVPFGGDIATLAEHPNRIHKQFQVLDELGLVLVPYTSVSTDGCVSESAVQLVDWQNDDLALGGQADLAGEARRTFVEGTRLFGVSDTEVRTFDIADRAAPQVDDVLALGSVATSVVGIGGELAARLGIDAATGRSRLEIVPANEVDAAPVGSVVLARPQSTGAWCPTFIDPMTTRIHVEGRRIYVHWPANELDQMFVETVDATDPALPVLSPAFGIPRRGETGRWGGGHFPSIGTFEAHVGNVLAVLRTTPHGSTDDLTVLDSARITLFDLRTPSPVPTETIDLPAAGGYSGMVVAGDRILVSRWVPIEGQPELARFHVDRVDVSDPSAPALLPAINVPGAVLAVDEASGHALTLDFRHESQLGLSRSTCAERGGAFDSDLLSGIDVRMDEESTRCRLTEKVLTVIAIDDAAGTATELTAKPIGFAMIWDPIVLGDQRVSVRSRGADDLFHDLVAGGWASGSLQTASFAASGVMVGFDGAHMVLTSRSATGLEVWDTTNLAAPAGTTITTPSWPTSVALHGGRAVCTFFEGDVLEVPLY